MTGVGNGMDGKVRESDISHNWAGHERQVLLLLRSRTYISVSYAENMPRLFELGLI